MKIWIQLVLLSLPLSAWSATWYVRQGVYGSQNGSSYSNAWDGITKIVWGAGGVQSGDTVYVCGTNIFTVTSYGQWYNRGICSIGVSGVTIRGDYPGDPYYGFGGAVDHYNTLTWVGPDANGVYWTTNEIQYAPRKIRYQVDGNQIYYLTAQTNRTWTGGLGARYFDGVTNFVKTVTGAAPSNNVATAGGGWMWNLNSQSNITFLNCTFIDEWLQQNGAGYVAVPPNYTSGPTHITFNNCKWFCFPFSMYPGNDYFTFNGCEMGYANYGIYGYTPRADRGAWNCTITNCYIHDTFIDPASGENPDLHGIGAQAACNWSVMGNTVTRTAGTAVDFYSAGVMMTNNTIANNFISQIAGTINSGTGIAIDSGLPVPQGSQAGFRICNNVIHNVGINADYGRNGIGVNCADPIFICNNTIMYCGTGISVWAGGAPVNAIVQNNIIASPTDSFLILVGNGITNTTVVDYNLFYTNAPIANPFRISPSIGNDTHSIFADPRFISSDSRTAADFRLTQLSPAIGAGAPVGIAFDFMGTPIPTNRQPDIGAYQFISLAPPYDLQVVGQQ